MPDLLAEFRFYQTNQDDMATQHNGKVIVIKNCEVIGVYDTHLEAFSETIKHHERGTFIVQQVSKSNETHAATFYSPLVRVE